MSPQINLYFWTRLDCLIQSWENFHYCSTFKVVFSFQTHCPCDGSFVVLVCSSNVLSFFFLQMTLMGFRGRGLAPCSVPLTWARRPPLVWTTTWRGELQPVTSIRTGLSAGTELLHPLHPYFLLFYISLPSFLLPLLSFSLILLLTLFFLILSVPPLRPSLSRSHSFTLSLPLSYVCLVSLSVVHCCLLVWSSSSPWVHSLSRE